MRDTPFNVLNGRTPSFAEMAQEQLGCAREQVFPSDTWRDRLVYFWWARRLRRAARWEGLLDEPFRRYLWHVGVLRYGVILFALVAIPVVLTQLAAGAPADADLAAALALLAGRGLGLGTMVASLRWTGLRDNLRWAEQFRRNRMALEERLRAPGGDGVWCIEETPEGHYMLKEVEPGTVDPAICSWLDADERTGLASSD